MKLSRLVSVAAIGLSSFLIGCAGKGVEIVRVPLISPVVVPALPNSPTPNVFLMNVAVKNSSTTAAGPDLWLLVYSEYWSHANPAPDEPPCSQSEYLHVGALGTGQSWAKTDYRIDRGSDCQCIKDACPGHVWLSLHVAPGYAPIYPGNNTSLHVNWSPDGDLAKETITVP